MDGLEPQNSFWEGHDDCNHFSLLKGSSFSDFFLSAFLLYSTYGHSGKWRWRLPCFSFLVVLPDFFWGGKEGGLFGEELTV